MSNAYSLYFLLLRFLLRIPFARGIILSLHVTAGTYRACRVAPIDNAELAGEPVGRIAQFLSTYQRVRGYVRPERGRRAVFMVYEPRFRRIVGELNARGIDTLMIGRGLFDYLFQQHLRAYLSAHERAFGEYALQAYERFGPDRSRYLRECRTVAALMKRSFSIETIILPKYNDDYTLEMIQAFHDAGWTTVVYDREGTVTKRRLELIPPIVARQAVACDAVITYNETHQAFFERLFELSAVPKPEIVVAGNPASDDWFHEPSLRNERDARPGRRILFFAFGEFSYVYDEAYLRGKDEVWRQLLTDIHDGLASHLRDHPDDELLYKRGAKGNRDYWKGSERLLASANAHLVPNTANANALIAGSDVIIAFQTTALIDAMHTDKLLIYCGWGDRYSELKGGLIDFEEFARAGAILHASSPEELLRILSLDAGGVRVNRAARKKIRETFTTNPDGLVARRFAEWVNERLVPSPAAEDAGAPVRHGSFQAGAL